MRIEGTVSAPPAPIPVALWHDNVEAWNYWMLLQTQWRTAGMDGIRYGLDHAAVGSDLRLLVRGRKRRARLLLDILACEQAYLDVWNSERQRRR